MSNRTSILRKVLNECLLPRQRQPLSSSQIQLRLSSSKSSSAPPKILITGGLGQLGGHLANQFRQKFGEENVFVTDISKPTEEERSGPFGYLDITDVNSMHRFVVNNDITWVIHYAALLSAVGERNVSLATQINVQGVTNIMEVCRKHGLRVFIPSSIGAFGPDSPLDQTPDVTIQRPRTIYGVSKVYAELLGEYYFERYGTDFRSLRFPGIISANTYESAGTTDYAAMSFQSVLDTGKFSCNLKSDTELPMMYIDDCSKSVLDVMDAPSKDLSLRTYNVAAMSFTPDDLENEIQQTMPNAKFTYEIDDVRQKIAETWPRSLDDSNARKDWGWKPHFELTAMAQEMFRLLKQT